MKRVFVPFARRGLLNRPVAAPASACFMSYSSATTQPPPPPPPPAHEDFVDLGFLAEMNTAEAASEPHGNVTVVHANAEPVLGIVRTPVDPEGTEYSRFHIPLETPRGGKPLARENSRALLSPWEEEALMRAALDDMSDATKAVSDAPSETKRAAAHARAVAEELLDEQTTNAEVGDALVSSSPLVSSRSMPLPDPVSLPYDDEKFADMILEMEVEGAIDDAWQDTRKAHIEDVKEVLEILKSLKVRDICCIDVSAKTGNFDYMMFGTCEGARHIHLAAWAAQEADSLRRVSKIKRKQTDELWEVVPIGRIVLNLMVESLRDELTLERKWAVTQTMDPVAAANAPVSEGRQVRAHGLWTLTLNLQDLEDFEVDYCKDILLRQ